MLKSGLSGHDLHKMKTLHFEVVSPGHSNSAKTLMIYLEIKRIYPYSQ